MIKRDITETVYEYDKEGKLVKKTVVETHEEENDTITNYPSWSYLNGTQPYCVDTLTQKNNCADSTISANVTTITG